MNITIHRGANQIGGCVTEYEYKGWRVFVDYGEQLPGTEKIPLSVEGLTHGDLSKSILLITHYHGDHVSCIADLPKELPIYIGQTAKEILDVYSAHVGHVDERQKTLNERLKTVRTFSPGNLLHWGEFQIMPITMDHSAFDAYAFKIEAGGLKVFHTGDFRTHGFRSRKLPKVIETYIGRVDYMVCEATNVGRPEQEIMSEHELQKEYIKAFTETKYNVVYASSTNIDRLFSLYHAAIKANRPFYVDGYQKRIMDTVAGRDAVWGKSKLYKYVNGLLPKEIQKGIDDNIAESGYVIMARAGKKFDSLLSQLPSAGRRTCLSMWDGYLDESNPAYNPTLAASLPADYEYLHTSGHCDMENLESLITMLNPKAIIPIHTDAPDKFAELFCEKWPVILMHDGETFSPINDPGRDTRTANIYACLPLGEKVQVIDKPEGLEAWALDERCLGEFRRKEDAMWALRHVVYAPERTIGYSIEDEEDMTPHNYQTFDSDLNLLSEFGYGGHAPGEAKWQEASAFAPGERAYALDYFEYARLIFPCEVVGPVTEETMRQIYAEAKEICAPDTYEEFAEELWDWDWDIVNVHPLIRLRNQNGDQMPEITQVQRVFLFPIK